MMYNNNMWQSHYQMGWGSGAGLIGFPGFSFWLLLGLAWAIGIKGYALWHAAKRNEPWWFFFLLIINTFGILELIYLIFVAKVMFANKGGHGAHHDHSGHSGHHTN